MCAAQINPWEGQQVSIPWDRVSWLCRELEHHQRFYRANSEDSPTINAMERNEKLLPVSLLSRVLRNELFLHFKTFGQLQALSLGGSASYKSWLEGNEYIIAKGREDSRVQDLLDRTEKKKEIDFGGRIDEEVDNRNRKFMSTFRKSGEENNYGDKVSICPQFCVGMGFYNSEGHSVEGNKKAGETGVWKIKVGGVRGFDLTAEWNELLNPVEDNEVSQERSDVYINKSNTVTRITCRGGNAYARLILQTRT